MVRLSAATAIFGMLLVRCFDATRGPPLSSRSRTAIVPHIFTGCPDATCASCSWDHEDQAMQTYCSACWPGFTLVDGNCVESDKGGWSNGPTLEFMMPVVKAAKEASDEVSKELRSVLKPLSLLALSNSSKRNTTNQSVGVTSSSKKSILKKRAKLDINQKVYIEGQLTIGNGEDGSFNKCNMFPSYMVDNPNKPTVKVCGTQIKMEVFVFGQCNEGYSGYSKKWSIGVCDTGKPSDHCETYSPKNDSTFGACQSWKATFC